MTVNVQLLFIVLSFFIFGCASAPTVTLPASVHILGSAISYTSSNGDHLEVVHDGRTNVVIVKLPDGAMTILPLENPGIEGRYKNSRMTLWEHDNGIVLWTDGNVTFSGKID